jgi:hypothetical protein
MSGNKNRRWLGYLILFLYGGWFFFVTSSSALSNRITGSLSQYLPGWSATMIWASWLILTSYRARYLQRAEYGASLPSYLAFDDVFGSPNCDAFPSGYHSLGHSLIFHRAALAHTPMEK